MATAHDVTAYILAKRGRTPAIKLHKLLYYSPAWSLVWDDRPIFKDRIEAWANGPVVPSVHRTHSRSYFVTKCGKGDPESSTRTRPNRRRGGGTLWAALVRLPQRFDASRGPLAEG